MDARQPFRKPPRRPFFQEINGIETRLPRLKRKRRKRRQSHTFTYFRKIAPFFPSAITPARIPDPQYRTVVQ